MKSMLRFSAARGRMCGVWLEKVVADIELKDLLVYGI